MTVPMVHKLPEPERTKVLTGAAFTAGALIPMVIRWLV